MKKKKGYSKKGNKVLLGIGVILFALGIFTIFFNEKNESKVSKKEKKEPKILIVMDDLGESKEPLNWFLENPYPLVLSFLPRATYSKFLAENLYERGYEIFIHLPMEPLNYPEINLGKDCLFTSMGEDEIRKIFEEDFERIPFALGVNNHMGSAFTSNLEKMEILLKILKEKNLIFLDSKTTIETKGKILAEKLNIIYLERDVFLDNLLNEEYIKRQMKILIEKSKEKGYGIGICHPHKETFKALKKILPKVSKEAKIVKIKDIIDLKYERD